MVIRGPEPFYVVNPPGPGTQHPGLDPASSQQIGCELGKAGGEGFLRPDPEAV